MKNKFLIGFLCFYVCSINSQNKVITEYYENGNISAEGYSTEDNKRIGEWKWFYVNGTVGISGEYEVENNKSVKVGDWKFYYQNGNLKDFIDYTSKEWIVYYENTEVMSKGKFIIHNGWDWKDGEWETFYDNGAKQRIETFDARKLMKIAYCVDSEGNSLDSGTLVNGNGVVKSYYKSGNLKNKKTYVEGLLEGECRLFYEKGTLKSSGYYSYYKTGEWYNFHENTQLYQAELWDNGLQKILSCYDGNGVELDKGTLDYGDGTVRRYNEEGELIKVEHYLYGRSIDKLDIGF
ncbi:MAG: hypothetical protein COA67_10540 [Lutibacter sp.]|nr:MAG: hypothetical protein COA67_10540 [Lutibacter sp.]